MKLLLISDLHFTEQDNDWIFINEITQQMTHRVNNKTLENEEIIIVILGDIIDRGGSGDNNQKFSEADKFISKLRGSFSNVKFLFIPGNHELKNNESNEFDEFMEFNQFCQKHSYKKEFVFNNNNSVYSVEESGINLILVDSNLKRIHNENGEIDVIALRPHLKSQKNIIFMHHPPCQVEGADREIVNSDELIATYSNFIFYGHQHGYASIPDFLEHDTDIHSIGTFLGKANVDHNEFILLDISDGNINHAYRYKYSGNFFVSNILFPPKINLRSEDLFIHKPDKNVSKVSRRLLNKNSSHHLENSDYVLSRIIGENITSIIRNNKLLLLTGDAGIGKSYELSNIYWNYENNEEYYPIWVELKSTNSEYMKKIFQYAQNNTINRKIPLLILDGFDEVNGDLIIPLLRDIGTSTYNQSEVKIIISTRTNSKISLSGFSEYEFMSLDIKEILTIALEYGITETENFSNCLNSSGCFPLAQIPFYLIDIMQIYLNTNSLPNNYELLDKIILNRFISADKRHPCALDKKLITNEYKIRNSLQILGFLMQSLHQYSFKNINFTRFFKSETIDFFNKSGLIIEKTDDSTITWEFEHNIFREFFTANYLSTLNFEDVLSVITFDEDKKLLRPSWLNTIAYLLSITKDESITNWLLENAKDKILEFDPDKFSLSKRNEVFNIILTDILAKNLPIHAFYDEKAFAQYFQNSSTIDYMTTSLNQHNDDRSIMTILHILKYCDSFYTSEQELKTILLSLINIKKDEYFISCVIEVLSKLYVAELSELINILFPLLENDLRPQINNLICDLLSTANVVDTHFDYICNSLSNINNTHKYNPFKSGLTNAIQSVHSLKNISKLILEFSSPKFLYNNGTYNIIFGELIQKASDMYQSGYQSLFIDFVTAFIETVRHGDYTKVNIIKQTFIELGELPKAYNEILKRNLNFEYLLFTIEAIMDDNLINQLIDSYSNDKLNAEVYKDYVYRIPYDSPHYSKLSNAILNKEDCLLPKKEIIDWNMIRKSNDQIYFNSLFDKSKFNDLIQVLLSFIDENVKCGQLLNDDFISKIPHKRIDVKNIRNTLYNYGNKDCLVTNFINEIDFDNFSILLIYEFLHNQNQVDISSEQIEFIKSYFDNNISKINFEQINESNYSDFIPISNIDHIIFFMKEFNFNCSTDKLLDMLMLPWYFFETSTSSTESKTLAFVSERIDNHDMLKERILNNIKTKKLSPLVAQTHIKFCIDNKLPDAICIAKEFFYLNDKASKEIRDTVVEYLIKIKGNSFVDSLINDSIENDFLSYLTNYLKTDNLNLINELERRNKHSEDKMLFLAELIKFNCMYGINTYYELAISANTLPDINFSDSYIPKITGSLEFITDISFIDILLKLLLLCFSDDFIDKPDFGLRRSLNIAINNLVKFDKFLIKDKILEIIKTQKNNSNLLATCNWYLRDIDSLIYATSDLPWDIDKTTSFIYDHKGKEMFF